MRIISLCPSITKLVFDLGAGADLVGVTKYCIEPREGVAGLEKLGGTKDPQLARIAALRPDLVLLNQEENRREDFEALVLAGIACHCSYPLDVPGAIEAVRSIAGAIGRAAAAEALVARIEAAWISATAGRSARAELRWAYLIWRKPWMAIGAGTYIDGLIAAVGGQNVLGGLGSYPSISADLLATADPHLVFLSSEPFPFKEKHRLELAAQTGLPVERFVLASGELLSWHCSHTAEGLNYAMNLLDQAAARGLNAPT